MPNRRMTRRAFTRQAMVAGAALGTAHLGRPSARAGQATPRKISPNEKVRVAIFGCRNRGWQLAGDFQKSGRLDVVAMCDCDSAMYDVAMGHVEKQLEQRPRFEKDFRRALDDKGIDAVAIATPDHWHALQMVLALEAGKHVYVEKPVSHNIDDGKTMVAARRRHPELVVVVGSQQRSGRHYEDARSLIEAGALGKISFCRAWATFARPHIKKVPNGEPPATMDYDMWVGPAPWRPYNPECTHYNWHFIRDFGTGDMANWGAHDLDIIRHFMKLGCPRAVTAQGLQVVDDAKEWPDQITAVYEYPEVTVAWELRTWTRVPLHGRSCGSEYEGQKGSLAIGRNGWEHHPAGEEVKRYPESSLMEPHVANFADCITRGAKPAADLEEGHKTAILCHLANISAAVGRRIEFDAQTETIVNDREAGRLMGREYRKPWTMPKPA